MELIGPYLAACVLLVAAGAAKAVRPVDTARAVAAVVRLPLRPRRAPWCGSGPSAEAVARAGGPRPPVARDGRAGGRVLPRLRRLRGRGAGPGRPAGHAAAASATPDTPATRTHVVVDLGLRRRRRAVVAAAGARRLAHPRCSPTSRGTASRWSLLGRAVRLAGLPGHDPPGRAGRGPAPARDHPGAGRREHRPWSSGPRPSSATRLSRRSFINRSAMVGSAVAVGSGVDLLLRPGTAYAAVCTCANTACGCGSTCCAGFSEFCCSINDGYNYCPTDTVMGGWWMADNSTYCGGSPLLHGLPRPVRLHHRLRRRLGILRPGCDGDELRLRPRRLRLVGHRLLPVPLRAVQPADRLHRPDRLPGGGLRPPVDRRPDLHHDGGRRQRHGRDGRRLLDRRAPAAAPATAATAVLLATDRVHGDRHGGQRRRRRLRHGHLLRQGPRLRRLPVAAATCPAIAAGRPDRGHGRHADRTTGTGWPPSDGGIFAFGDAPFAGSMGGRPLDRPDRGHGRHPDRPRATGWSPPTAASSPSATPPSTGSMGGLPLNAPDRGHGRHPDRPRATGWSPPTAASSPSATPPSRLDGRAAAQRARSSGMAAIPTGHGLPPGGRRRRRLRLRRRRLRRLDGRPAAAAPVVGHGAARRAGYWLVAADGGIFAFDAPFYGSPA